MIKHNALPPQRLAVSLAQGKTLRRAMPLNMSLEFRLVVTQQTRVAMRLDAVGPTRRFHLEHAQIEAQLDFLQAIVSDDTPHINLARLEGPRPHDAANIQTHPTLIVHHNKLSLQPVDWLIGGQSPWLPCFVIPQHLFFSLPSLRSFAVIFFFRAIPTPPDMCFCLENLNFKYFVTVHTKTRTTDKHR